MNLKDISKFNIAAFVKFLPSGLVIVSIVFFALELSVLIW